MKTTLPTLDVEIKDGKVVKKRGEVAVKIIDSIFSQDKWERYFPLDAEKIALSDYIDGVRNTPKEKWSSAICLKALKGLFCYLDFEKPIDFKGFCDLFKMNDIDFLNEFVDKINEVFSLVYPIDKKKD